MPYISQERREALNLGVKHVKTSMNRLDKEQSTIVAGDLNFIVYSLALEYIRIKGKGYNNISDAIKALTGAAHEVERRVLDPYEDEVIIKNGDIE